MADQLFTSMVTIATAIIGLALIAVLVSKNANTTRVIGALSGGLSTDIGTAISPITGGSNSFTPTLNFGSQMY